MTIEAKYGVPTVAVHTDKFDRVVRSVAARERDAAASARSSCRSPSWARPRPSSAPTWIGVDPHHGATGDAGGRRGAHAALRRRGPRTARVRPLHAAARRAGHRGQPAPALPRQPLDGHAADRAADRGARGGDAARQRAATPDEVVGRMRSTHFRESWEYTVEKVAVNAVMAGARPEYFPVILALAADRRDRAEQQLERDGSDGSGQRPDPRRDRDERGHRRDGPLQPRQCHHRPRLRPAVAESPGRLGAGHELHGQPGQQLRLQQRDLRRERGAEPVGAFPRPARLRAGRERGQRLLGLRSTAFTLGRARAALARARRQHAPRHGPAVCRPRCCSTRSRRGNSSTAAGSRRRTR